MNRNQVQQVVNRVEKFNAADGDVVVLTGSGDMRPDIVGQVFSAIAAVYKQRGLETPVFTILRPGQKIETLSDDKMRDHGWVRANCPQCLTYKPDEQA